MEYLDLPSLLVLVVALVCFVIYTILKKRKRVMPKFDIVFRSEQEEWECRGKYVAKANFLDKILIIDEKGHAIAHEDPSFVVQEANRLGFRDPAIRHIPETNQFLFSTLSSA